MKKTTGWLDEALKKMAVEIAAMSDADLEETWQASVEQFAGGDDANRTAMAVVVMLQAERERRRGRPQN